MEKTPLKLEIDAVNGAKRKYPEVKETGTVLISKLKSQIEGRGKVPKDELNRYRKVFKAMIAALEDE